MLLSLGHYEWRTPKGDFPHYAPPDGVRDSIDLRALPQQSSPGMTGGIGVFWSDAPLPDCTLLGGGDDAVSTRTRDAWEKLTGYRAEGATIADLVVDHLCHGDPLGQDRCKPPVPTVERNLNIHLGGILRRERFEWGTHPLTNRLQAVIQADMRELGVSELSRKRLDDFQKKYRVSDWKLFLPADIRDSHPGPKPRETTITDDFNRTDAEALGTGSGGWSWTEVIGDIDIVSNQAVAPTANQACEARAESALSSADHYGQIVVAAYGSASDSNHEAYARFAAAASTYYRGIMRNSATNTYRLFKQVAGTPTQIGSTVNATPASAPNTLRTTANGSTISFTVTSVERISTTDTAITTNTRAGFGASGAGTNKTFDDFEAADLAASGGRLWYYGLINAGLTSSRLAW